MKISDSVFWKHHHEEFKDVISEISWPRIMEHVDAAQPCELGEEIYVHLYKTRRSIEEDERRDNPWPNDAELDDPQHGQADGINRGDLR